MKVSPLNGSAISEQGVCLVVHLLRASAGCLGDGHYGSCCCQCVNSNRITEVLDLTSPGCRQLMHKWDSVLEALEFGKSKRTALLAGTVWIMWHQDELITSDDLANDLLLGGEHIYCTPFPISSSNLALSPILFQFGSYLCSLGDVLCPGRYAIFLVIV